MITTTVSAAFLRPNDHLVSVEHARDTTSGTVTTTATYAGRPVISYVAINPPFVDISFTNGQVIGIGDSVDARFTVERDDLVDCLTQALADLTDEIDRHPSIQPHQGYAALLARRDAARAILDERKVSK